MNLSPLWASVFKAEGWETHHWTEIGDPRSPDSEILEWASDNDCVLFTHDLDFGALLAFGRRQGPSVVQLRSQELTPSVMGGVVVLALRRFSAELERGVLVTIDPFKTRVRLLPFGKRAP